MNIKIQHKILHTLAVGGKYIQRCNSDGVTKKHPARRVSSDQVAANSKSKWVLTEVRSGIWGS